MINGMLTSDSMEIAQHFNEYFCSVFTVDDGSTRNVNIVANTPDLQDLVVTREGIINLLLNLDDKKSPGPDCIPNLFLK